MSAEQGRWINHIPHYVQLNYSERHRCRSPNHFSQLLDLLKDYTHRFHVSVHAYALVPSQIHLLMSQRSDSGIDDLILVLNRLLTEQEGYNARWHGRLLEDTYWSCLVEPSGYAGIIRDFIEQVPVRQLRLASAKDWVWSSCGERASWSSQAFIRPVIGPSVKEEITAEFSLHSCDDLIQRWVRDGTPIGSALFIHRMRLRMQLPDLMKQRQSESTRYISRGVCDVTRNQYDAMGFYCDDLDELW